MRETVSRVAIIEPSAANREWLRKMLQGMDWVLLETECSHYDLAPEAMRQATADVALLALDDDPAQALDLLVHLTQDYPRMQVIVISSRPDLLVKAYRQGAKALLDHPVQLEPLSIALKNLSQGLSLQRPPKGRIYAFLSSRGGVGCTSLAVNLGCTLAQTQRNQVILVDLDLHQGAADIALDLMPQNRLNDVAVQVDRLDLQFLKNSLSLDKTGLMVLPRPARYQDATEVNAEHVQRVLTLLKIISTHLVLDLSKGWAATDLQAMRMADVLLLVAQLDLVSVRNVVLMLASLQDEGLDGKVRLVLNRAGADFGPDSIGQKKAEEVIARPFDWQVPNDPKSVMGAWNAGQPLLQFAPKSKVQLSLADLAKDLARPKRPR